MAANLARQRILVEASDLFLAHGAGGVTMRGLAARLGVTPMALYRYFDNRDDVLQAITDEGHATFLRYLHRAAGHSTPAARFLESGRQYLAFALDHPRSYAVMFMEHTPQDAEKTDSKGWTDAATFRFLVDRICECAAAGIVEVEHPEEAALTVWAQVHGLVSLFLAGKLNMDRPAFEAMYLRSLDGVMRSLQWRGGSGMAA